MKRICFLITIISGVVTLYAQKGGNNSNVVVTPSPEASVTYYMPKTTLVFNVTYEEVVETKGLFCNYAKSLLNIDNAITTSKTTYRLKDIHYYTKSTPDYNRMVKVMSTNTMPLHFVDLTNDGRLQGYNNIIIHEPNDHGRSMYMCNKTYDELVTPITPSNNIIPIYSDRIKTKNKDTLALEAQKLLLQWREVRFNLLAGELEHNPTTSDAIKEVLDELDKQEQQVLALFMGTREVKERTEQITFTPIDPIENLPVVMFSPTKGLTKGDIVSNKDDKPISISITSVLPTDTIPIPDTSIPNTKLYYNVPGVAQISVLYDGKSYVTTEEPITQWGKSVVLPSYLFQRNPLPRITFDPQTGNLISIVP